MIVEFQIEKMYCNTCVVFVYFILQINEIRRRRSERNIGIEHFPFGYGQMNVSIHILLAISWNYEENKNSIEMIMQYTIEINV